MAENGTVAVDGKLTITRIKSTYSDELIQSAKADGVTLPSISPALSEKGTKALASVTSILTSRWFVGAEEIPTKQTPDSITSSDALGSRKDFKENLEKVLTVIATDGCEANGQFLIVGDDHGDVHRWTVEGNAVTKEETIVMTWPDGSVYRYHRPYRRW